ncbi:unnamed protein product [Parnassius mnemosyne]|uniref:Uncharacterized protein n=1 Tax=Parnassius mnemosyne TaxID=213953 RepID=A0AAV1M9N0_9NEOP
MSDNDEPEETVKKRCFLGCAITAPIISFTADTLASSRAILEQRKKHLLKYSDIELPKEIDDSIGYHSKCRNNFNALKAQFKVDLNKPSGSKVPSLNVAMNISAEDVDAENNDEDNWSDVDDVAHESNVKKSIGGNKGSSTNLKSNVYRGILNQNIVFLENVCMDV